MEFPLEWGETETDGDHQWWCTNTYKLVPPSSMEVTQHPFPRGAHGFLCRPPCSPPRGPDGHTGHRYRPLLGG